MQSIILSRRDLRENDQIISLYTREQGKVEVLARGVKKILSKNSAHLEPGCFVEAEIIPGKEISHLGSVQPINIFKNIRGDLSKLLLSGYALAWLNNLIQPHEKDERLFDLIYQWLGYLDKLSDTEVGSLILDLLVVRVLAVLGFDILYDPSVSEKNRKLLQSWLAGKLSKSAMKTEAQNIHQIIWRFAQHHGEKKLADWANLV